MASIVENEGGLFRNHVIACLVENHPGVLSRISGMFSSRGYNIESLAVGTTQDEAVSRITIACNGDDRIIDQIIKQLAKLVEVIRVEDLGERSHVERELILIKVRSDAKVRSEVMQVCDIFRASIVDVAHGSLVVEVCGSPGKNQALIEMLEGFGIMELVRTGRIALNRGAQVLAAPEPLREKRQAAIGK